MIDGKNIYDIMVSGECIANYPLRITKHISKYYIELHNLIQWYSTYIQVNIVQIVFPIGAIICHSSLNKQEVNTLMEQIIEGS